jgi:hypothetical protein
MEAKEVMEAGRKAKEVPAEETEKTKGVGGLEVSADRWIPS